MSFVKRLFFILQFKGDVSGGIFLFFNFWNSYETKHDFCQITKVRDNKNHASSIRQLKIKLLSHETPTTKAIFDTQGYD
jgi:hypothetical protein